MSGSSNFFSNTWAFSNGGGFRIDTTATTTFTMEDGTYMDQLSASAKGGALYLCSQTSNLVFKESSKFTRISATTGGGVYFCPTTTTIDVNWDTFSTNDIRATSEGSIMYVEGDAPPTITFSLANNNLFCQSYDLWQGG